MWATLHCAARGALPSFLFWLALCGPASAAGLVAGLVTEAPAAVPVGEDVRLAQQLARHAGQPVVINFWASWCEPCRDEMPALARLPERLAGTGLVVLTVAVADRDADAALFMQRARLALPVLHDRDQRLSRLWGARLLPCTVILDRQHRIVARAQGVIEWEDDAVLDRLRRLLK
ncbi:redoxin domain-containing protein [Methyloversatilis sp.]|uniref:TlpA family protein disulfide reductase n=1 Tax=Methyloversatilis sp. TaxID=2569862 RepID=UPI003F70449F